MTAQPTSQPDQPSDQPDAATRLGELTIAVLGGTGPQGRGLARRFAASGLNVVIGSRSEERAQGIATELTEAGGTIER